MFYVVIGLCAVVMASVHASYWFKKHRLLDREIEGVIERKLKSAPHIAELLKLREERLVMRNLLHDIWENEGSVTQITKQTPDADRMRIFQLRNQRRKELFGESLIALGQLQPKVEWRRNVSVE